MPKITIDNQDYDLDTLSDEARAAVLQTACMAYSKALQAALPSPFAADTMKFN